MILQQSADATSARDVFELDRIDRALDQLVAHPSNTKLPEWQLRDARANASKVLKKRRAREVYRLDDEDLHETHRAEVEYAQQRLTGDTDTVESFGILWWLRTTTSLTEDERSILVLLARGEDAMSLASLTGIPVKRMREQISRARRVGRLAYGAEVGF
ncbi:hypothetical protein [Microbacterium invictum]|uniref:DNA-directed RNA polymerase specialized sigma24 family protein n=1 Tax=Microbacterium invictum TaxID=515415 RepID=A0AA40VMG4_9MICO|nr:hypothetical protein [Microbacterium invictum]MBB4140416.1 DNA-directed RNA polymerase specialized sigma24 family protein [Microbacterium invictum]